MAIKAILFDKDGTLVDFYATWSGIARKLALEAAGDDPREAERLLELSGYDAATARFTADSVFAAGTNADVVALWYPAVDAEERPALVSRFDSLTAVAGAEMAVAIDGMPDALRSLRDHGYRLGVATNDSTEGAERTIASLGVASLFDAAYGYDAVARPKPAPDVILAFADSCGLKPSEIAMVGDNRHDLETARSAGAGLAVGVLSGTGTRESLTPLADVILGSIAELPAWLAADAQAGSALRR